MPFGDTPAERRVQELERELKAAVEHHERYTRAIDKALGEPRNLTDGWLLEEHLAAINRLKPGDRDLTRKLPPEARDKFWSLITTAMAWRGWATSPHQPRPEMLVLYLCEAADLLSAHDVDVEVYT